MLCNDLNRNVVDNDKEKFNQTALTFTSKHFKKIKAKPLKGMALYYFTKIWCRGSELNQRREALQASALPLSYPGNNDKNYQYMQSWYLFVGFCQ